MRYAMAIDTRKCVGCSDCVVACQTENNVPIGYCRDWVVEVTDGTYPQLEIEIRQPRPEKEKEKNRQDQGKLYECLSVLLVSAPSGHDHFPSQAEPVEGRAPQSIGLRP